MSTRAAEFGLPQPRVRKKYSNGTVGSAKRPGALRRNIMRGALATIALAGAAKGVHATYHETTNDSDSGVKVVFVPAAPPANLEEKITVEAMPTASLGLPQEKVDIYKDRISQKEGFEQEHLAIPLRYKDLITQSALEAGISPSTALGIIAVENGGGEAEINPVTGATGVAQFLAPTAREYGLIVNGDIDERADPLKSIPAMVEYLRVHKELFGGNEGIAVWSYHAGAGVVMKALQVYFIDTLGEDAGNIGSYGQAISDGDFSLRERIEKRVDELINSQHLTVDQLLSNPAVENQVTSKLEDFSASYPYQVAAAAQLLAER